MKVEDTTIVWESIQKDSCNDRIIIEGIEVDANEIPTLDVDALLRLKLVHLGAARHEVVMLWNSMSNKERGLQVEGILEGTPVTLVLVPNTPEGRAEYDRTGRRSS